MINIHGPKLDREVFIGCSGGVDSMAIVDFLRKKHDVNILFFNHGTDTSDEAEYFLKDYFEFKSDVKLHIGRISKEKTKGESQEEYWRNQRYEFFHSFSNSVITCHHLDDCVETWVWSCMHGNGKIIPYSNKNVIRPFLSNRKEEFVQWCRNKNVPWVEDISNEDLRFTRNYIRKELIDKCLVVNPGLYTVIRKKVLKNTIDSSAII